MEQSLELSRNEAGYLCDEIVFQAFLSDGRNVIAVPMPIPEPATLCFITLALALSLRRRL